jgi:CheY-like chemotaxis protein
VSQDFSGYVKGMFEPAASSPVRCMVVDDDHIVLELLASYLRDEGYQVEAASSGKEALARVGSFQPDFIFMDIDMPELNGIETTRAIRARTDLKKSPVIVAFTSLKTAEIRETCFDAGMDDFLEKPLSPEELNPMLDRWLRVLQSSPIV